MSDSSRPNPWVITVTVGNLVRYRNASDEPTSVRLAVISEVGYRTPAPIEWHKPGTGETSAGSAGDEDYRLYMRVWSEETAADGDWIDATRVIEIVDQIGVVGS